MIKFGLVVMACLFLTSSYAQIGTGKVEEPKKDTAKTVRVKRVPTDGMDETVYFAGMNINQSFRKLEENVAPYGDPLAYRVDEVPLLRTGFHLGMRNRFHSLVTYEVALSWDKFGETYNYQAEEDDSSFTYTNTYSYISLPVQVYLTHGKDLRYFVGGGIQPMLAMKYAYEEKYTDSLGGQFESTIKSADRMSGLTVNLLVSAGVQWRFSKLFSLYAIPSYVYGLTSTFGKEESYKHYIRAWNFRCGLTLHIPN